MSRWQIAAKYAAVAAVVVFGYAWALALLMTSWMSSRQPPTHVIAQPSSSAAPRWCRDRR